MEFRILGPLEVLSGGHAIDLGGGKQRTLLAVLLLDANTVVSRDRLVGALWEDAPPETAPKALQVYVSGLRKALGRERLQTKAPGYVLALQHGELDRHRFDELRESGRPAEALALWRGPALADFARSRFARTEIARLEDLRLGCLEDRIDDDLGEGDHAELAGELEALVAEHPLRERLRGQLMLALYRSGRQAEALAAYQAARRSLVDELGIEPGRELRELQRRILEQDPGLELRAGDLRDEAAGDRLRTLSSECRRVLSLASVLGREFGLVALERVADYTGIDRLLQVLDEALAARVVEQVPGALGWLRFVRADERESLYGEIPAAHRARLHRRVAAVLEALYAVDPEPHRAEVAHHLELGGQG